MARKVGNKSSHILIIILGSFADCCSSQIFSFPNKNGAYSFTVTGWRPCVPSNDGPPCLKMRFCLQSEIKIVKKNQPRTYRRGNLEVTKPHFIILFRLYSELNARESMKTIFVRHSRSKNLKYIYRYVLFYNKNLKGFFEVVFISRKNI